MWNPFTTPLPMAPGTARELGHPNEGFDPPQPHTQPEQYTNAPDFNGSLNTPLPYHGPTQERFQESNPGYAGEYHPSFLDNPGVVPGFSMLGGSNGQENLIAPRQQGERAGTNRLFKPHGPVTGAPASGWSGHRTDLRTPIVGNSGPVTGGRDNAAIASTAYFASQAAYYSQAASDAAMVSAL